MQSPAKALILDDDDASTMLLEYLVKTFGFHTECAVSIADARMLLTSFRPDVAILDLSLPDGNGLEIVPDIQRVAPTTAIATLTGMKNRVFKSCEPQGISQTFSKPIDPYLVGDWLKQNLDRIHLSQKSGEPLTI